jgi:hypothetical protein
LKAVEKWGDGHKGVRESNERGWTDQSNIYPQRNPFEISLNINNERQDCKIGTV